MFELILLAPVNEVETLSDALDALDALSVSVEDADAHTPAEQALFGEPGMPPPKAGWERSRIVALFATEALARDAAGWSARIRRSTSRPSKSGSIMSSTIASGLTSRATRTACEPLVAWWASQPS